MGIWHVDNLKGVKQHQLYRRVEARQEGLEELRRFMVPGMKIKIDERKKLKIKQTGN